MTWIDMHCDTLSELMKQKVPGIDVRGMKQAGCAAQFFAAFICAGDFASGNGAWEHVDWDKAYPYALEMLERAHKEIADHSDVLSLATKSLDLQENMRNKKVSAFLTVEEGGILDGELKRLEKLYEKGVRLVTLTWNYENCIGYPNSPKAKVMMQGLKPFGFEVIGEMNRRGMVIDVSHLSDGGFWDVIKYSKAPVVASHSNARALCPHPRNLSDEMIRVLAGKGGIAGVNFYPYFLNGKEKAGTDDLLRHIEYMYQLGGEDFIALGTDFDGFHDAVNEIDCATKLPLLYDAMQRRGFHERQMEKFCWGNAKRLIQEMK